MSLRGCCNTQTRRSKSPRVSEASEEGKGGGGGGGLSGRKVSMISVEGVRATEVGAEWERGDGDAGSSREQVPKEK